MSLNFSDARKIGIGLTAFGLAFTGLGVLLLFDNGLLAMGNILFLSGVCLIIGPARSVRFFFQRKKARASALFFAGIALVLLRFPVVGVVLETAGFIYLFGHFFPVAVSFMRRTPVLGNIIALPGFNAVADRIAGGGGLPV